MRHRAQATIEFMVLLGAAAALGVTALALYHHLAGAQGQVFSSMLNSSPSAPQQPVQQSGAGPSLELSLAATTYANRSNTGYLLLTAPSGAYLGGVELASSSGQLLPSGFPGQATDGITLLQFALVPAAQGSVQVSATANVTYGGNTTRLTATAYTFASQPGQGGAPSYAGQQLSASIDVINQSIDYALGRQQPIGYAVEWSHCSYHDFWGHLRPFGAQCGDANWDFNVWSDSCYWDDGVVGATYCVRLNATPYAASAVSAGQAYNYSIRLGIYNSTLSLGAGLASGRNSSELLSGTGAGYGNATVAAAGGIGPDPSQYYVALNDSGNERLISESAYQPYGQAMQSLGSTMAYYNGTGIQPSDLSIIQAAIDAYDSQVIAITNASNQSSGQCRLATAGGSRAVSCEPISGLFYTIDASVRGVQQRQVISVGGSTVNVR